jgi:hypothetical protein
MAKTTDHVGEKKNTFPNCLKQVPTRTKTPDRKYQKQHNKHRLWASPAEYLTQTEVDVNCSTLKRHEKTNSLIEAGLSPPICTQAADSPALLYTRCVSSSETGRMNMSWDSLAALKQKTGWADQL